MIKPLFQNCSIWIPDLTAFTLKLHFQTKALFVGGCRETCFLSEPTNLAQLYDPDKDEWIKVKNFPSNISSTSMDLLDNIPTIIGGFLGDPKGNKPPEQVDNGILWQYHITKNEWKPHPNANLAYPGWGQTVFSVPRQYLPACKHNFYKEN